MKIAFDENVSPAMVRVFQSLARERHFVRLTGGLVIECARDYAPAPNEDDYERGCDVPWLRRFSRAGGKAILSGDTRMTMKPHERLALVQEGFIVVFFASGWAERRFFPKCAMLLNWWPVIAETFKTAPAPSFWRVPDKLTPGDELHRLSTDDLRLLRIEKQKAAQPSVAKARRKARKHPISPHAPALKNLEIPEEDENEGS